MVATPRASPARRSAANGSPTLAAVHPVRRPRGVRRRRDESAGAAVEIEELDSEVMRQNSYNYFQHHGARMEDAGAANPNEAGETAAGGGAASRKRQRTLAEQLEDLCLQSDGSTRSTKTSGAAAAAACRQAWNRVFAAQMAVQQQRNAAAKEKKAAAAAAAPPPVPAQPARAAPSAPANGLDVDMDANSAASSAAEDADLEDAADDEESGRDSFKVFGGVPDVKGMFFSAAAGRQRPMERMFRHYVTMAAERSRGDGTTTPRGDELVLFQPGPTSLEFPYSLFTPEQVEDLRARHSRKKKRQAAQDRAHARALLSSPSTLSYENSWRFQELDSSDEADVSSSAEDSDMDVSVDGDSKTPQLAGAVSHSEWFVDGEDEDEDDDL